MARNIDCGSSCLFKKCKRIRACVCDCHKNGILAKRDEEYGRNASIIYDECKDLCNKTQGKLDHQSHFCETLGPQQLYNNVPHVYYDLMTYYDCPTTGFNTPISEKELVTQQLQMEAEGSADNRQMIAAGLAAFLLIVLLILLLKK